MRSIVVGGGAAGFFGAITCAQANPRAEVLILEASREVLTKVRISGGGRCNVTHACFDPAQLVQNYPRGYRALRGAMSRFQPRDTVHWFQSRGVSLKTEPDGRMFPVSNHSQTIIDCLLRTATTANVKIQTAAPVRAIHHAPETHQFQLTTKAGQSFECDRLLIATGSHPSGYRLAQGLGHQVIAPVPSLFTFQIPDRRLHQLAGVSVSNAQVTLKVGTRQLVERGPLLITHWGFSGPVILKLSAWAARELQELQYQTSCSVHWLPEISSEQIRQILQTTKQEASRRKIVNHTPFQVPSRLWQYWVHQTGLNPEKRWADLSKAELNQFIQVIAQGHFKISGKGVFKDEFVTCGGIALKEINFKTMESRICPGLFLAGELLDVDGVTGGFNFQNAWTTGWLAGQAMGYSGH